MAQVKPYTTLLMYERTKLSGKLSGEVKVSLTKPNLFSFPGSLERPHSRTTSQSVFPASRTGRRHEGQQKAPWRLSSSIGRLDTHLC